VRGGRDTSFDYSTQAFSLVPSYASLVFASHNKSRPFAISYPLLLPIVFAGGQVNVDQEPVGDNGFGFSVKPSNRLHFRSHDSLMDSESSELVSVRADLRQPFLCKRGLLM